jgi:hypothetical protein
VSDDDDAPVVVVVLDVAGAAVVVVVDVVLGDLDDPQAASVTAAMIMAPTTRTLVGIRCDERVISDLYLIEWAVEPTRMLDVNRRTDHNENLHRKHQLIDDIWGPSLWRTVAFSTHFSLRRSTNSPSQRVKVSAGATQTVGP